MYRQIDLTNVSMINAMESYMDTPLDGEAVAMEKFNLPAKIAKGFHALVEILKKCVKLLVNGILHPLQSLRKVIKRDMPVSKDVADFLKSDYPKLTQARLKLMEVLSKLVAIVRSGSKDDLDAFDTDEVDAIGKPMHEIRIKIRELDISDTSSGTSAFRISDLDRIMRDCKDMSTKMDMITLHLMSGFKDESGVNPYDDVYNSTYKANSIGMVGREISSTCICMYELCHKIFSSMKSNSKKHSLEPLRTSADRINTEDRSFEETKRQADKEREEMVSAMTQQFDEANASIVSALKSSFLG